MEIIDLSIEGEARAAEAAAGVIRSGGLVVFPAERLYGIAADATDYKAVEKVFAAKARNPDSPLPVMVGEKQEALEWVETPDPAIELMDAFWPGPLTLALPVKRALPHNLLAGGGLLAIRVPGNGTARQTALCAGAPVTATSANKSGHLPPAEAEAAIRSLIIEPDLVIDAGKLAGPPGSTVIKIERGRIEIARPGVISGKELDRWMKGG